MTGLISVLLAFAIGIVLASFMAPAKPIKWKTYRICIYAVTGIITFFAIAMIIGSLADGQESNFGLSYVVIIVLLMFAQMYVVMFFLFFYKELLKNPAHCAGNFSFPGCFSCRL